MIRYLVPLLVIISNSAIAEDACRDLKMELKSPDCQRSTCTDVQRLPELIQVYRIDRKSDQEVKIGYLNSGKLTNKYKFCDDQDAGLVFYFYNVWGESLAIEDVNADFVVSGPSSGEFDIYLPLRYSDAVYRMTVRR